MLLIIIECQSAVKFQRKPLNALTAETNKLHVFIGR